MLPESWRLLGLGDICQAKSGLQTGPFGSQLHASDYVEDGIPVVMPRDMIGGRISTRLIARITAAKAEEVAKHQLKLGDLVFSRRGDLGRFAVVGPENVGWICGTGCMRARLNDDALPDFIFCQLVTHGTVRWLESNAVGQTMPNLNTEILSQLPLRLPPLPEQQKIAAILSTWDRAIELTEKLIAAKQKRKQALMQQLLTGKVRLSGYTGKWKTWKAGDLFKPISKKNHPKERVLSVTQDQGVVYRDELDRKIAMNMDSTGTYKLVEAGDFVISLRSFQGGLEMSRIRGIASPAYHVIRSPVEIDREFFRHFFKSYEFIGRLAVAVIGIRDGKQISFDDFSFLKFSVPSVPEQNAISEFLNAAESEINTLRRKFTALMKQKKGLMQQLLTGKVRVKVDVEAVKA